MYIYSKIEYRQNRRVLFWNFGFLNRMSAISNMAVIYGQVGFFLHLLANVKCCFDRSWCGVVETWYRFTLVYPYRIFLANKRTNLFKELVYNIPAFYIVHHCRFDVLYWMQWPRTKKLIYYRIYNVLYIYLSIAHICIYKIYYNNNSHHLTNRFREQTVYCKF